MSHKSQRIHRAFIILGSNLGERVDNLEKGCAKLDRLGTVNRTSNYYETEPWGVEGHPAYLNQVIDFSTVLPPGKLMRACLGVERELGRIRKKSVTPRILDIDILLYDDRIVEQKKVTIPHPRMHLRRFALIPLAELAPEMVHPVFGITIRELLDKCPDRSAVNILETTNSI